MLTLQIILLQFRFGAVQEIELVFDSSRILGRVPIVI